jgi:acyl transferase domain-containing protein
MARGLYGQNAVFRQALDQCHSILLAYLDAPLLSVLFGDQAESALIHETSCTQPALFAIEYALAQMWLSWGIKPYAVMGHSVGEYAAACIAGVFPLEDGLKLIAARGRLMQDLPKDGQMAVVFGDEADVAGALAGYADRVSVAALNGPANTVISGEREALSQVRARLQGKGIATKALTVSHAFHSHLLEPMLDAFYEVASQVRFSPPAMKMVSNLSGEVAAGEVTTAAYWCRHARQTTLFAAGMQTLEALRCTAFLEIGPQPVLAGMGQSCLPRVPARQWIASLRRGHDDWPQVLLALGGLYTAGAGIDWPAFYQGQHFNKVTLPTYPFQRQRYWLPDKYDLSSLAGKSRGDAPLRPDAKAAGSGAVPSPSPAALSGETGKQPAQATVPKIVRTLIQHQLAETKDLAGDAFDQVKEMPLQDLGLDSLMLMGIRAEIIHRFPAVKNMPMNLFFDDSTLQQILDYVEAHAQPGETAEESESLSGFLPAAGPLMAEWENEFVPGVILRIDKHLAHKDYDRNVLVGRTQQVAADVFLAEMNQDTGHTFFYEHPKDHVTSMYLLEAISQLGRAVPHLYYEVPLETAFIIHDLETRFEQFAETTQPVFMLLQVADKVYKAGRLTHIQIECFLLQAGKVFGQVKGTGQFMVAEVYNTLRNIT